MANGLTERQRRAIAGRARTLFERIDGPSNVAGEDPAIPPDRIIAEWKDLYPDERAFRDRLSRDGLTEATVREAVAATSWPAEEPLPDWVDTVDALVQHVETARPGGRGDVTVPEETPFAELLVVVAEFARERLPEGTVPMDAASPAVEWLLSRLEMVSLRPTYVEFKSFVDHYDPDLAAADPDEFEEPPTEYYEEFVEAVFDGGFRNVCLEYPVLARFLGLVIDAWVDAVVEVCRRIDADEAALRSRFGVEGDVTELEPLSKDTHGGGRVPFRVRFETGAVVYKPRPVDAGIAFHTVLERLDEHLPTPSFESRSYLSREGYGWMEPIRFREPDDEAALDRYYERAGAILCVAYALGFTDCQHENLIVDGEHPTIVDGETAFHPWLDPDETPVKSAVKHVVDRTVLLTGLLPWDVGDPRKTDERGMVYTAGFGSEGEQVVLQDRFVPNVEAINTDVMSIEPAEVRIHPEDNVPTVDGEAHPPGDHADALIRGFERTHRTIRELHDSGRFFPEIATRDLIDGVENRLVYRSTMKYTMLRQSAVARNPLRDGVRLSVEFDELAVPFVDAESDRPWRIHEAERRSLRRFDVPRLTATPGERTLSHDGKALGVGADESGYDRCRRRLDSMDAADGRRQSWLIRRIVDPGTPDPATASSVELTGTDLERTASALFEDARDAGIETADGTEWFSVCQAPGAINFVRANPSLFWGRGGIALAAGALYEVTGQRRYRRSVEELLDPVVDDVADGGLSLGLGGTKGLGSVVYTLSVVADLVEEAPYRRAALEASRSVTGELLAGDDTFDVMEGAAGTLLGLLAHYERFGGRDVLDRAIACGERLLEARVDVDGHRVWLTIDDGAPLTGFSHGASGIAYALARLGAVADESRFADAAREALRFEDALFDASRTNWADSPRQREYQDRWCHGRTGMALARIGIGDRLDDESLVAEAGELLAATANDDPAHLDNLCCGNFGRTGALLVAARRAGGEVEAATELAGRCVARRERDGALSLPGHDESFVNPTFFDGVSGAAYALLRLRDPDALPCVLLLE